MRIPASCGLSGHGISVTGGLCVDVPGRRAVIGTAAPGQRPPMLPGPPDNRGQAAGGTRRSAVRGYGAGGVVSTTGGPVDTTIVTALPGGAVDPPAGLCEITSPESTVGSAACSTVTVNPASSSCDVAELSFCPTTSGTAVSPGPVEMARFTVLPCSTSPPDGSCAMTLPAGTVGSLAWLLAGTRSTACRAATASASVIPTTLGTATIGGVFGVPTSDGGGKSITSRPWWAGVMNAVQTFSGNVPPVMARCPPNGVIDSWLPSGASWYIATAVVMYLSLIHISEPTRLGMISYAVFCLKKKKKKKEESKKNGKKKERKKKRRRKKEKK